MERLSKFFCISMKRIAINYLLVFLLFSSCLLIGQINPSINSSSGQFSLTCSNPTITLFAQSSYSGNVTYLWTGPQMNMVNGPSLIVNIPGVYILTVLSGTILETLTVSVATNTTPPSVMLTAGSSSLTCLSPTVLIVANTTPSTVSYTWIEPGVGLGCSDYTCVAGTPGVYGVTVVDLGNGCQKTTTINIPDYRFYPVFSSVDLYTISCPNGTVNLQPVITTDTANISFQWNVPAGAITSPTNNSDLTTNSPGTYTVIATNTLNGCSTTAFIDVFACVGINELNMSLSTYFYPNPFTDKLTINLNHSSFIKITLVDLIGQTVFETTEVKHINEFDLGFLPRGVYFILFQSKNYNIQQTKVIKN